MMPKIDLTRGEFTDDELALANRILHDGALRHTKPKVTFVDAGRDQYGRQRREPTLDTGSAAYVWRMVAFQVSPVRHHQCLPVLAQCDLPGTYEERQVLAKRLDDLADRIANCLPKAAHYGTLNWGRVLGKW